MEHALAELEQRRDETAKELGALEQDRDALLEQADVPEKAARVQHLKDALTQEVARYARLKLSDELLDRALERYREEKQPGVLRRASELWSVITDGAWQQVRSAVEHEELEVIDRSGHVQTPDVLSRGTAEQLYLCLRLALAETMAERGDTPLPLVLDDVLVNFDPERARSCARVLGEVASARQVLLLSCRPSTVEVLRAASERPVNVVRLPRFDGRQGPAVTESDDDSTGRGRRTSLEDEQAR